MKEKLTKLALRGQLTAASLFLPFAVLAQTSGSTSGGTDPNFTAPTPPQSIGEFEDLIVTVVNWLFSFLVFLAIVFVMIAAYKYLTASGDPEKVKSASNTLIYAAIAIAVALLARGLPFLISGLIGVELTGGPSGANTG